MVLKKKRFPVIIEEDNDGYVITCPVFEGCYTQGKTLDEAMQNIKEAIDLCLDDEEKLVGDIMIANVVLEN